MRQVAEVKLVLLPLRLVETQLLPEVGLELSGAVAAAERLDRVAGHGTEEHEVERDRDENGHDREEDPLQDVVGASHCASLGGL